MSETAYTQLRLDIFQKIVDQRSERQRESVLSRYIEGHIAREDVESVLAETEATVYRQAENAARRGTTLSWNTIRARVWERDGPVCKVCGLDFSDIPRLGEVGHCVDRMLGGQDSPDNLEMMCYYCNRLKPPHLTRSEYEQWKETGGWMPEFLVFFQSRGGDKMTLGELKQFWLAA